METGDPHVHFVGAGPGAAEFLTLRAVELLSKADLIVYDQLVPRRLLDYANLAAERICVRDLPGPQPEKLPHVQSLLIERARLGQTVVRLKSGDPLIFGRGSEEIESLRQQGIAYEIVPGVTAALAAAACLDIPLTHRRLAGGVAFISGHEIPTKPGSKIDWAALARFPGTLAVYMGIARLPLIVAELLRHGMDPATPAAIVERAGTGEMRSVATTLETLDSARRQAGLEAPGLILIGEAIAHRPAVSWFAARPLFGKRVLVTRPRHQARPMIESLEKLGAVTFHLPTMTMAPAPDTARIRQVLARLRSFDWIVFTSANGVTMFMDQLREFGGDARSFGDARIAVVGPATAETLAKYCLKPDLIPERDFSADGLLDSLKNRVSPDKPVLIVRADRGRDLLPKALAPHTPVEELIVYTQVDCIDARHEVFDFLRRGEIEFVTLTSSNIARGFLDACDDVIAGRVIRGEIRLVAISPQTGRAIRERGFPVAGEALQATTEGLISEVVRLARPVEGAFT